MRNKIAKYKDGFVKVRLESSCPERFFRLCALNDLLLWNIIYKESSYEFELSAQDFFRLQPFRRKTNAKIKIMEKHGMPFFFKKNKKRKAFLIGIFSALLLLYVCSLYIWEIDIRGNQYYADETVIDTLKKYEISQGIRKSKLECGNIAEALREEFSELVWVSVKIKGTSLIVDVKENENRNVDQNELLDSWDLVAKKDGILQKIVTREGMPVLQEGDVCKKGDVIVTGAVEILDNDSMVKDYVYIGADADILLETTYSYYEEFSLSYQKKIYEEKQYTYPVIQLGMKGFYYLPEKERDAEMTWQMYQLRLSSSFYLPISVGKIVVHPYQYETNVYEKEDAIRIANEHLREYMAEMAENKKDIVKKDISTTLTSKTCVTKGTITVWEEAVEKVKISEKILKESEENEN